MRGPRASRADAGGGATHALPALAVYVGLEAAGTFGPYRYRLPVHEPLARAVLEAGIARGFDLLYMQAAGTELQLSEAEQAALSPFDRDALARLGAHPYLVFMADLRLRMAREPGTLEYF